MSPILLTKAQPNPRLSIVAFGASGSKPPSLKLICQRSVVRKLRPADSGATIGRHGSTLWSATLRSNSRVHPSGLLSRFVAPSATTTESAMANRSHAAGAGLNFLRRIARAAAPPALAKSFDLVWPKSTTGIAPGSMFTRAELGPVMYLNR